MFYKLNKGVLKQQRENQSGLLFLISSLFFLLSGCVLEIFSSSGRKMEFPTSVPESSSACASLGADRSEQAGAECSLSFISIAVRRKLVRK